MTDTIDSEMLAENLAKLTEFRDSPVYNEIFALETTAREAIRHFDELPNAQEDVTSKQYTFFTVVAPLLAAVIEAVQANDFDLTLESLHNLEEALDAEVRFGLTELLRELATSQYFYYKERDFQVLTPATIREVIENLSPSATE